MLENPFCKIHRHALQRGHIPASLPSAHTVAASGSLHPAEGSGWEGRRNGAEMPSNRNGVRVFPKSSPNHKPVTTHPLRSRSYWASQAARGGVHYPQGVSWPGLIRTPQKEGRGVLSQPAATLPAPAPQAAPETSPEKRTAASEGTECRTDPATPIFLLDASGERACFN